MNIRELADPEREIEEQESRLLALPTDVMEGIVGYLSPPSIASLSAGSRQLAREVPRLVTSLRPQRAPRTSYVSRGVLSVPPRVPGALNAEYGLDFLLEKFPRLRSVRGTIVISNNTEALRKISRVLRGFLSIHISWNPDFTLEKGLYRDLWEPRTRDFLGLLAVRALLYPSSDFSLSLVGTSEYVYRYLPDQKYVHVTLGIGERWDSSLLSQVPFEVLGLDSIQEYLGDLNKAGFQFFMKSLERDPVSGHRRRIRELVSRGHINHLDPALFPDLTTIRFMIPDRGNWHDRNSLYITQLFTHPIESVTTLLGVRLHYGYDGNTSAHLLSTFEGDLRSIDLMFPNLRYGNITIILYPFWSYILVTPRVLEEFLIRLQQTFKTSHPDMNVITEVRSDVPRSSNIGGPHIDE